MEDNKLIDILDPTIANTNTSTIGMQMEEVAKLADRCLNLNGRERPNMMEVWMELERLWSFGNYLQDEDRSIQEIQHQSSGHGVNCQEKNHSLHFSTGTHDDGIAFNLDAGR